jgi:hypothetical protein
MKFLLILVFFAAIDCVAQKDCKLKLEKDSIKVFTCVNENSKFKSVKTTFELNSSLPQLAAIMVDIDHLGDWQYMTLSTKLLKKVSEREFIYYTEVAAPMFTNNRDFVIQLTLDQDPVTREMTINLVSIPDYLPRKEGVVRVPFSKARWTVKPLGLSRLSVEYYIEIDIGGAVPAWIVNMVAHQAPYETFKALRAQIGHYKGRAEFVKP